ncbi:hypothetical protein ACHAW6_007699 [Cyclotella cf. meneghiniana]
MHDHHSTQFNGIWTLEREELDEALQQQWTSESGAMSAGRNRNISTSETLLCSVGEQPDSTNTQAVIVLPLQQWNEAEATKTAHSDLQFQRKLEQASILRKITVGFGIGKLLHYISQQESYTSTYSWVQLQSLCSIDNFAVEFMKYGVFSELGWEVTGVHMIHPFLSLQIDATASSPSCNATDRQRSDGISGRDLFVTITSPFPSDCVMSGEQDYSSDSESILCHLLGGLVHFLFSGGRCGNINQHILPTDDRGYDLSGNGVAEINGHTMKKNSRINFPPEQQCGILNDVVNTWTDSYPLVRDADFSRGMSILGHGNMRSHSGNSSGSHVNVHLSPLMELGYPPCLSQLVTNLVDCGLGLFRPDDSYHSLAVAIDDMKTLLQQPNRFLFDDPLAKGNPFIGNDRMYGRSKEIACLTNIFCRVASSGETESIFVVGFSGCGKTRLVLRIFESVRIEGGFAVTRKFDEMQSSSPLAVVLSAVNDLCISIAQKSSQASRMKMYEKLSHVIPFLTRVLPNVVDLLPSHVTLPFSSSQAVTEMNFNSICFTIQQLMRVISSPSRPILLFLDDLQWADVLSLRLIQSVLCDVKGSNCVLFAGGFRDNEVEQGHVLLEFLTTLSTFNITTTTLSLNGISAEDVNTMVSDILGVFPRMCRSLSDVVYRKTNGNPYFALEFLRSLIDRNLITYSLREKYWKWDVSQIGAEDITDNVLYILKNNMSVLEESAQTALKVASCFGINVSIIIAKKLAATPQYHNLQATLDQVIVKEGYMDFDGVTYRFVHDRVREAAYGLIPSAEKDQFHFTIGMALQSNIAVKDEEDTSVLFATIDQINRYPSSMLRDDSQRIFIANLNHEAGIKAIKSSNFMRAYGYTKAAVSMLPNDSWEARYDLSLKCNLHFAKAAYSCGYVDQARDTLDEIIQHGESLDDKSQYVLDSYSLLVSLFYLARKDLLQAFHTCLKVLILLGEDLPANGNVDKADLISTVKETKSLFQKKSNEELLAMHEETSRRNIAIMQFYDQLSIVSYLAKPEICAYFMARWAHFSLTHNVACKYTPGAFVSFSVILCCEDLGENARIACRIGKIGVMMLNSNASAMAELPGVYLTHYVYAGSLVEPIQTCVNLMQRAYEIGMQTGNPSKAAFNLSAAVAKQIKAGTNLLALKIDIANYLQLAGQYAQKQLQCNLLMMKENVSRLIGDETVQDEKDIPAWEECEFCLEMMTSFYLGHMERVYHKSKLWEELDHSVKKNMPPRVIYIAFFSGLASASLYSYGKKNSQRHLSNIAKSVSILENAMSFSEWNFKNKACLLRAVLLAVTDGNDVEIGSEFDCAILASRSSNFVHEEGLACELAGAHYKKTGNRSLALTYFRQAESCYQSWGSLVKVRHMTHQIELMGIQV